MAADSTESRIADVIINHCHSSTDGLRWKGHPLDCLVEFMQVVLSTDDIPSITERCQHLIDAARRRTPAALDVSDLDVLPLLQSLFRSEAYAAMPRPNWHTVTQRVAERIQPAVSSSGSSGAAAATAAPTADAHATPGSDAADGLLQSVLARRGVAPRVAAPPAPRRRILRRARANAAAPQDGQAPLDRAAREAAATPEELRAIIRQLRSTITKQSQMLNMSRVRNTRLKKHWSSRSRPRPLHCDR